MQLKKYQEEGVQWLMGMTHGLLADEMGLGKSAQAILAASRLGLKEVLVVCPAIARENWRRECLKWSAGFEPCVVSYETATTQLAALSLKHWDLIIADEGHYLKSPFAQRTQAVYGTLAHHADRSWTLTGTPAPNHAGELWAMLMTFGGCTLDYDTFIRKVCYGRHVKEAHGEWVPKGTKDPEAVARMLSPYMLRRTVVEVMPELPPLDFHDLFVEPTQLPSRIMDTYFSKVPAAKVAEDLKKQIELVQALGEATIESAFDHTPTLRRWLGANKVVPVADLVLEEMDSKAYDKIVIWAYHRQVIEELHARLGGNMIYGAMTDKRVWQEMDEFNTAKRGIMVAQYTAAGTAVTFDAREQIFCEYDWNPATNLQAAKRCHRGAAGVAHPVRARFAIVAGGVDDVVLAVARRKTRETAAMLANPDLFAFG